MEKVTVIETVEPIRDRYIRDQLKDMERKLRSEMRESEGRKQKTELATVVEMLSQMPWSVKTRSRITREKGRIQGIERTTVEGIGTVPRNGRVRMVRINVTIVVKTDT